MGRNRKYPEVNEFNVFHPAMMDAKVNAIQKNTIDFRKKLQTVDESESPGEMKSVIVAKIIPKPKVNNNSLLILDSSVLILLPLHIEHIGNEYLEAQD